MGQNRSDRRGTGAILLCTEVCELCSNTALAGGRMSDTFWYSCAQLG